MAPNRLAKCVASFAVSLALVATLFVVPQPVDSNPPATNAPIEDIGDAPNSSVMQAGFRTSLVQWGTTLPYTGTGQPGVILWVEGTKNLLNWTVEAWVNETATPAVKICNDLSIHFSPENWIFEADTSDGDGGFYAATPTTIPQRLMPNGDQCPAHVASAGTWHVYGRVEGKDGGPLGIYDAADGRHVDAWDRTFEADFQVPM